MQLQESKDRFEAEGIKIVGLSYDSPEILAEFSKRQGIEFPLLADSDSSSLKKLGLLNTEGKGKSKGVAFPGVIFLDKHGRIKDAFFEDSYRDRPTPGTLLARIFPNNTQKAVADEGLEFTVSQTGDTGVLGSQWELSVTFDLSEASHLYAPNKSGYIPLNLELQDNPLFKFGQPSYPEPKVIRSELLNEEYPAYTGRVTVTIPVKVAANETVKNLKESVATKIKGKLQFQICTDEVCFMPQTKDVEWSATVKPLDRQRVQEANQH